MSDRLTAGVSARTTFLSEAIGTEERRLARFVSKRTTKWLGLLLREQEEEVSRWAVNTRVVRLYAREELFVARAASEGALSPGERGLAELRLENAVEGVRFAEILSNRLSVAQDEVRVFRPGIAYPVRASDLLEAINLRLPPDADNRAPAEFLGGNLLGPREEGPLNFSGIEASQSSAIGSDQNRSLVHAVRETLESFPPVHQEITISSPTRGEISVRVPPVRESTEPSIDAI